MSSQPEAGLYAAIVRRPVATIMGCLAALVFGVVSYTNLPLNLMPDLDYPTLTVRTEFPGAAPGEVETYVSVVLEEALSTVPGLSRAYSISRAGLSDVVLEFEWNTDMDESAQVVRERLGLVDLQDAVRRPLVLRFDPNLEPILRLALSRGTDGGSPGDGAQGTASGDAARQLAAERGLLALRALAEDEIRPALERLTGVAAVKIRGGLEQEVRVEVDEGLLHARGFTLATVVERLQSENVNIAGGSLLEGQTEYLIRTLNEFKGAEDISNLMLADGEGRVTRLGDLARVTIVPRDREVVGRVATGEAVEIAIYREADANIVEVSQEVRASVFGSPAQQAYVAAWLQKKEAGELDSEGLPKEPEAAAGEGPRKGKGAHQGKGTHKGKKGKGKKGKKTRKGKKGKRGKHRGGGMSGGGERGGRKALRTMHRHMTDYLAFAMPDGTEFLLISDQATFIEGSISDVIGTAWWGGLLAVLVLFLFLRHGASTAIIATAIPVSVVVTFAPMYLFGVSLNLMSLGGLALCIGMLVDNSIVVLESVHRCREEGDTPFAGAVRGTAEVAAAVTASTLTTVAVFLPIVFVTGVAGQLFGHLALTVVFGLLSSLAVALFLIPVLVALQLGGRGGAEGDPVGLGRLSAAQPLVELRAGLRWMIAPSRGLILLRLLLFPFLLFRFVLVAALLWPLWLAVRSLWLAVLLTRGTFRTVGRFAGGPLTRAGDFVELRLLDLKASYARGLRRALGRPSLVLLPSLLLFLVALLGLRGLGQELLPEVHQGVLLATVRLPVGTPLERTLEIAEAFADRSAKLRGVDSVYVSAGVEADVGASSGSGENTADLVVRLSPSDDPKASEEATREAMRRVASKLPGFETEYSSPSLFSFRTPLEIEVRGTELAALRKAADKTVVALQGLEGLRDIRSNLSGGYPEVQIRYDRDKLQLYGLDIGMAAQAVRNKVEGRVATDLRGQGRRTDVRVVLRQEDRESLADLARLNINPAGLPPIPLEAVAELREVEGPSEIRRSDGERSALITASLSDMDLASSAVQVQRVLDGLDLGPNIRLELAGQSQEMDASLGSLRFALLLAIFLVYIIMASLFESVLQPFVILFAVPFALVGVVAGLWATGTAISVIVLIGGIVLAGVVVNNAIILVDYANRLRARGLVITEALIEAGSVRLRPILISTLTTVLGLLPMAFSGGEGSEIRQPLALTIIAGLVSATVLTLVVVPVLYSGLVGRGRES